MCVFVYVHLYIHTYVNIYISGGWDSRYRVVHNFQCRRPQTHCTLFPLQMTPHLSILLWSFGRTQWLRNVGVWSFTFPSSIIMVTLNLRTFPHPQVIFDRNTFRGRSPNSTPSHFNTHPNLPRSLPYSLQTVERKRREVIGRWPRVTGFEGPPFP